MRAIVPPEMRPAYETWRMSPGLACQGFVFLTGVSGMSLAGIVSPEPAEQIEVAFSKADRVLREGGLGFADVVEMTSYHVGLQAHLQEFMAIRARYVQEPYPAWTAIEVAGFVAPRIVVELRIIARQPG